MRRAIVTGVSRGIGRAVAEMLLAEGWAVWGMSRTAPLGLAPRSHRPFFWLRANVGDQIDLADACLTLPDSVDALIHCAGIRGPYGPFLENDAAAWEQAITTNLLGAARVVRAALPLLQRSDDGRILLMSGGGAFSPESGYSAYAASKGGTVSLMETLAAELEGSTVTINCVAPGFVPTDIHKGTPHENRDSTGEELGQAVACIRHLLSAQAHSLNGKTVSAAWDDWASINQLNVEHVNGSAMGTRTRHSLSMVADLAKHLLRRTAV